MWRKALRIAGWTAAALVAVPVAIYAAAVLVNRHDRPPSPDALRLAEAYDARPAVAPDDNAFVYLLGFDAAPDEDPRRLGRRRLAVPDAIDTAPGAALSTERAPTDFLGVDAEVTRLRTLCDDVGPECLRAETEARAAFERWSSTHPWLLERYRRLLAHSEWRETILGDISVALPSYTGAMHGQRLLLWQVKALADSGDATGVGELLASDLRFWRMVLAASDLLITKMIAVAALQRHFEWGNLALRRLPPESALAALPAEWLEPLTVAELSLRRTLVGEWTFASRSLLNVRESFVGSRAERLVAPLFQPQDTVNRYSTYFTELRSVLEAPLLGYADAADAASKLAQRAAADALPPRSLYNLLGALLLGATGPADFGDYARRVADSEGVRRAAVATATLRAAATPAAAMAAGLAASALRNPYDDRPFTWDAAELAVVFVGLEPGPRGEHRLYY